MSRPDGGPAFPALPARYGQPPGMTLRDWFAGQALAPLILETPNPTGASSVYDPDVIIAAAAYRLADAMLAERGRIDPCDAGEYEGKE